MDVKARAAVVRYQRLTDFKYRRHMTGAVTLLVARHMYSEPVDEYLAPANKNKLIHLLTHKLSRVMAARHILDWIEVVTSKRYLTSATGALPVVIIDDVYFPG